MLRMPKLLFVSMVSFFVSTSAVYALQTAAPAPQPAKTKLAGEVFKNIQVLKDMPESQLFPTMSFFTDSLGVGCQHCHEQPHAQGNWPFEKDTPAKLKARQMIAMVREMNSKFFAGEPAISCNTCHRGTLQPVALPAADLEHWIKSSEHASPLPVPEELAAKYRKVTGIAARSAFHTQSISFKTTTYGWKTPPTAVTSELQLAGPEQTRLTTQGATGRIVSVRDGKDGWLQDSTGHRALQRGELRSLANEASAFDLEGLEEFTFIRTLFKRPVYGRDAYVVEATNGGTRTWLFFDAQSGFLLRQRSFFPSFFADGSWDVEFDDYRPVGKFTLPFIVRVLNPAGSGVVIREATFRDVDLKIDSLSDKKP